MFLVLSMSGFWMYHSFKYVKVTQGSEYASMIPGYVWLCLNVPKSVRTAFALHLPLSKGTIDFSWKQKLDFFYSSWNIWFSFGLNIFTSKISNLLLPLGAEGSGCCESYPTGEIPNEYIYDDDVVVFSLFGTSRSKSEIHKRCNSVILLG